MQGVAELQAAVPEYKMSFADIVQGRDASVRVTNDKLIYAVDLIQVFTGKNINDAGQVIRRLLEEGYENERFIERQLSSHGGRATRLVTFRNAILLIMSLKGKIAQKTKLKFVDIIERYIAGDLTLIGEIQSNAQSASPVAQMARESLGIATEADSSLKRRREIVDLERAEANVKQIRLDVFGSFIDTIQKMDPTWRQDSRLVVQSKDFVKNIMFDHAPVMEGGDRQQSEQGRMLETTSLSEVAMQLKMGKLTHGEMCTAGKKAKELYVATHGKAPEQRKQFVDGAERLVNVYMETDRDILVHALQGIRNT